MPDSASSVADALAAVRAAVAELQEANFDSIEGYSQAKANINAALQVAKEKGASAQELLDAGKPQAVDIDDAVSAGAATRKARKLRLLERQFANRDRLDKERQQKERQEQERAARVAERLALRRGGPEKERIERERLERERKEAEREEAQRAERVAQKLAERRAKALAPLVRSDSARASPAVRPPMGDRSASPPTSSPAGGSGGGRFGGVAAPRASDPEPASMRDRSRSRGRGPSSALPAGPRPRRGRGSDPLPPAVAPAESRPQRQQDLQQQSLSALLGRPPCSPDDASSPDGEVSVSKVSTADVPLSVMMGGSSALNANVVRIGACDLSTGGEQVCFSFTIGKCFRWNCRFKHIGRS
mmetsp:Transcript_6925/g.19508  ORF Transcript_6925/g.19508 Transcript_6925/m.19508 type:complete len:359 (-) Transcript_6925:62-1138(-)